MTSLPPGDLSHLFTKCLAVGYKELQESMTLWITITCLNCFRILCIHGFLLCYWLTERLKTCNFIS
ncbi:hypothetical protein Hanom_Chr09g00861671 [Helianthus anomalus]